MRYFSRTTLHVFCSCGLWNEKEEEEIYLGFCIILPFYALTFLFCYLYFSFSLCLSYICIFFWNLISFYLCFPFSPFSSHFLNSNSLHPFLSSLHHFIYLSISLPFFTFEYYLPPTFFPSDNFETGVRNGYFIYRKREVPPNSN